MISMSNNYTREQYVRGICAECSNHRPSELLLSWLCVWTVAETPLTAPSVASYNLLNCKEVLNSSTNFNIHGVQNYKSLKDGCKAVATVLASGDYPHINRAIVLNDVNSLLHNDALITPELHRWGTGIYAADIARWLSQDGCSQVIDSDQGTSESTPILPLDQVPDSTVPSRTLPDQNEIH